MEETSERTEMGEVRIANEVVSIIAGLAAAEVKGVTGMSGGLAGGIAEMIGKKNLSKGVKVEIEEKDCTVDLFVVIDYGFEIPVVAGQIQHNVERAIRTMTGLNVRAVNIRVVGVHFPQPEKVEEEVESDSEEPGEE